jgi:hypothetical protein
MRRLAIASSSLRRWPTEVTPMLKPQILQPGRYVHAVIPGSGEQDQAFV